MNAGGSRRQQQAPQSRLAAAPLNLERRLATMRHDDALTGLPGLGPTAALARQISPGRHAAPAQVQRQCCRSRERS